MAGVCLFVDVLKFANNSISTHLQSPEHKRTKGGVLSVRPWSKFYFDQL